MDSVSFISAERLRTYEVHTDSQKKAVALHNHTLQLGSSLMSMIALLELSLRNSTNQFLIADFGDNDWLLPGRKTFTFDPFEQKAIKTATFNAKKAIYSKLKFKEKSELDKIAYPNGIPKGTSHKAIASQRQSILNVSHGQILAQTSFSFWKRLYSHDYEIEMWKPSIKKVFPNKKLKRGVVAKNLETIYTARNRVAHHEPVYGERLNETIKALDLIRDNFGARSSGEDTPFKKFSRVQYLRLRMDHEAFLEAWHTLT